MAGACAGAQGPRASDPPSVHLWLPTFPLVDVPRHLTGPYVLVPTAAPGAHLPCAGAQAPRSLTCTWALSLVSGWSQACADAQGTTVGQATTLSHLRLGTSHPGPRYHAPGTPYHTPPMTTPGHASVAPATGPPGYPARAHPLPLPQRGGYPTSLRIRAAPSPLNRVPALRRCAGDPPPTASQGVPGVPQNPPKPTPPDAKKCLLSARLQKARKRARKRFGRLSYRGFFVGFLLPEPNGSTHELQVSIWGVSVIFSINLD